MTQHSNCVRIISALWSGQAHWAVAGRANFLIYERSIQVGKLGPTLRGIYNRPYSQWTWDTPSRAQLQVFKYHWMNSTSNSHIPDMHKTRRDSSECIRRGTILFPRGDRDTYVCWKKLMVNIISRCENHLRQDACSRKFNLRACRGCVRWRGGETVNLKLISIAGWWYLDVDGRRNYRNC